MSVSWKPRLHPFDIGSQTWLNVLTCYNNSTAIGLHSFLLETYPGIQLLWDENKPFVLELIFKEEKDLVHFLIKYS